jgi:hypothetical protein
MTKKSIISLLIIGILLVGCAQVTVTGSGNIITQEEAITGFDQVSVQQSFDVSISQGEEYKVVISVDDNVVQYLDVRKDGNTLKIRLDPNRSYSIIAATMEAEVVMPEITALELSGASSAQLTGFASSNDFAADLSGSGTLRGDIEAGDTSFGLSGSSDVSLSGSGGDLEVDTSGSSFVDLSDFSSEDADLSLSGSSIVTVNVNGTLNVNTSGSSNVYYLGNPTIGEINSSGSSSVQQK